MSKEHSFQASGEEFLEMTYFQVHQIPTSTVNEQLSQHDRQIRGKQQHFKIFCSQPRKLVDHHGDDN